MANNFFEDNLPKEHTEEYPSIQEGSYLACLGKVHQSTRKDGARTLNIEHVLIQRRSLDNDAREKPYLYTDYDSKLKTLSLRKKNNGDSLTIGVMFYPSFLLTFDGMSNKFKGFQTFQKRLFAKNFNALNEESGDIDWNVVAKYAGQVVSFQVIKNEYMKDGVKKTNMNLSFETYSLIPGQKIPLEQLQDIYEKIEVAREKAKAEEASGSSAPVPDAPPEKYDLPF